MQNSDRTEENDLNQSISLAKMWYESAYPVNSKYSITRSVLRPGNSNLNSKPQADSVNYSQFIKPDWPHAASYKRFNANVVELPNDSTVSQVNTSLGNSPTGPQVYNPRYSRSSVLIINDSTGYHAYIMTIIADSAYIGNNLKKLYRNKYYKRDPDYSGVVLYSTPTGNYVNGWIYKNGSILMALPPPSNSNLQAAASPDTAATLSHIKTGKYVKNLDLSAITTCTPWIQTVTVNGVLYSTTVLDEICTTQYSNVDDSGSPVGGSSTGTPSSNGGGSPANTNPCTVPAATSSADAAMLHGARTLVAPAQTVDNGGFPSPTTTTTNPCPVVTTTIDTIINPCGQKVVVSARAANAIIAAQNTTILNNTTSTGIEYGADQNVTNLTGTSYVNTPVTPGTSDSWTPGFTWNSTNGYTIGYSHGHPGGTGPSPADVISLVQNLTNPALTSAGNPSLQFYENNAQVTTETSTGNYVVTITNWPAMQNLLNSVYANQAEQNTFDAEYVADGRAYLSDNPSATGGDAAADALMTLFQGDINIYYAPHGSTNYQPLIINSSTGTDTIATINCP